MKKPLKIVIYIAIVFILSAAAVFYLTSGMVNAANEFFTAAKKQDITTAHSLLSKGFKTSTDETALKEFLTHWKLLDFEEASWSSRQISGGLGELNGEIITSTGGVIPLSIRFVKENDTWKIHGIKITTSGLQAG